MIKELFHKIYKKKRSMVFMLRECYPISFRKGIIPDEYIIKVKTTFPEKMVIKENSRYWSGI